MKVHSIFHVTFLNHIINDFLLNQHQKSWELVIIKNDERFWYVNSILNFKRDKRYNLFLLKYYVDWKNYFSTWKSFNLLNNCKQALDEFHLVNLVAEESHELSYVIFQCQYQEFWSSTFVIHLVLTFHSNLTQTCFKCILYYFIFHLVLSSSCLIFHLILSHSHLILSSLQFHINLTQTFCSVLI